MSAHLSKINIDQRLYVMRSVGGVSCYGFEVLHAKACAVAQWIGTTAPDSDALGTPEHYAACMTLLDRGQAHASATRTRCPADLTPQLVGLEGATVRVVDAHGETRTFRVGRSTGWLPCHLEMRNTRDRFGDSVTGAPFRSVEILRH
ncbi:hypothetical protein E4T66_18470 [Sinimarinibacterium sp. CAU 1509]|uniref:hypothetical protein n=1 Tax=Sinimarinibacterium sp. CAU 1509 TaxID=2562283 RepID=UPI0010AD65A8|nr:hypothetical protein [Sinimarinibacterium sp. CAU 1509]TJY57392.1 hypothetical protein E4T66_18470 [Sinimarinibacterium sp. CAU 1509]